MTNIVNIVGGLGNQLFQLAFGESLARFTGHGTLYDLSDFATYQRHGGFGIERLLAVDLPRAGPRRRWTSRPLRRAKRLIAAMPAQLTRPLGFRTDREFRFAQADLSTDRQYFYGYWQGVDYPADILNAVIGGWQFHPDVVREGAKAVEEMGLDLHNDIAVHVRLGDYLTLPRACHLVAPDSYYRDAIARIRSGGRGRKVWLFSDDLELARKMPTLVGSGLIDRTRTAAVDLYLLSLFRAKVISASTFGWWAAALSGPGAQVVFPVPWVKPDYIGDPILIPAALPGWQAQRCDTAPPMDFDMLMRKR